ncbi:four helix bundle protein [bacterium]|nr:four helix bundle protein [bacterium]
MRMVELRERTKQFALRIIRLQSALPKNDVGRVIGNQVLRSGTSVAANLREASRARSDAEFIAKLGIVEQELDETALWLELLVESGTVSGTRLESLQQEADELIRVIVASIKTAKRKR